MIKTTMTGDAKLGENKKQRARLTSAVLTESLLRVGRPGPTTSTCTHTADLLITCHGEPEASVRMLGAIRAEQLHPTSRRALQPVPRSIMPRRAHQPRVVVGPQRGSADARLGSA